MNRHVRRKLINIAKVGGTITYGEIMREFHIPRGNPRPIGIGHVVGHISEHEHANDRPRLSAIVVRGNSKTRRTPLGHPGGGFFGLEDLPHKIKRSESEFANPRLTEREERFIMGQQKEVWEWWRTHDDPERDQRD